MMFQNLKNADRKKICIKVIEQIGLQSEKPERKAEIANCLQLDTNYGGSYTSFKEQLAKWIVQNYYEIKDNPNEYFQYGKFKMMTKQARELLINLCKKCEKKIAESQRPQQRINEFLMKNPYLSYPNMGYMPPYNPYGMMPGPNIPPGYNPNNKSLEQYMKLYNLSMQTFFMHNNKYGYPMNQMYMPSQMGTEMPKYDNKYELSQNSQVIKSLYYPYQMPPIPQHPATYAMQHQHPMPMQPGHQPKFTVIQKSKPDLQLKPNKDKVGQSVDENDSIAKKYVEIQKKQLPQFAPFNIYPPSMCKGHREDIPEYLPEVSSTNIQVANNNVNESSQIQIVQKIPDANFESNKNKAKVRKQASSQSLQQPQLLAEVIQRNKSKELASKKSNQLSNVNMFIGTQYKDEFKFCPCSGYGTHQQIYNCSSCNKTFHYVCTLKKQAEKTDKTEQMKPQKQKDKQLCHFCFMEELDPLNKVELTIGTAYLVDIRQNKFSRGINFQVFDEYLAKNNSQFQIQLRCMRLQDSSNSVPQYTWPDECLIMLNSEKVFEFQALQNNSSLKKRKDTSIFLTNYIYQCHRNFMTRKNIPVGIQIKDISIQDMNLKKIRNYYVFILGIYLTRKKTPDQLCEQIKRDPNNKVCFAETAFSKESNLDDQQVEIEQIKVNLMDPFTWNLIDMPVRGKKCIHGQCFDLKTFLSFMNVQRVRQWKCPVCNKDCRSFCVDIQQLEALKQFKKQQIEGSSHKLSKQISFHRDGRTTFILLNDQEDDNQQKISGDPAKTKIITKDQKESL